MDFTEEFEDRIGDCLAEFGVRKFKVIHDDTLEDFEARGADSDDSGDSNFYN